MTLAARPSTSVDVELISLSGVELLDGYANRDFTPLEVLRATRDRIDRLNPDINAFYVQEREHAETIARASTQRWSQREARGLLDGVPITLKETLATVGTPLPSGTRALADAPAAVIDSPVAISTQEAGGVRLGKTVMPDYGMLSSGVSSLHGITRSPWDLSWTVGGSSSGASAAAAARFGPIHIGSDIGGSVRLPASWTGLASLKPTYGIVPVDPPYIGRTVGPLARSIADVALAMKAIARPDPDARDYTYQHRDFDWDRVRADELTDRELSLLRVAVHTDAGAGLPTDATIAQVIDDVAATFERAGARVDRIEPIITPQQLESLDLFLRTRSWLDIKNLSPERRAQVLPFIRDWVITAADHSGVDLMGAYQVVQGMRHATIQKTNPFDIVLSPVAPVAAFPAEWHMPTNDPDTSLAHIAYTAPYNFSEQPAATVNAGFTADGRPVGVQIAGRRFDDVQVLRVARWFEAARSASSVPIWPL